MRTNQDKLTAFEKTNHDPPNKRAGENCDEYPFASTSEADLGGQVSKCVIQRHNSRKRSSLVVALELMKAA